FLAILTARLPPAQQPLARRLGLTLALGFRILLLLTITWVMTLTTPLFSVGGFPVSGRGGILVGGGAFLGGNATRAVYANGGGDALQATARVRVRGAFVLVLAQMLVLDLVFSLDSVITAVGMVTQVPVMVTAMALAMLVMLVSAGPIADFV